MSRASAVAVAAPADSGDIDYLQLGTNANFRQFLTAQPASEQHTQREVVIFSDQIVKVNEDLAKQSRDVIVTDRALYHFKPGRYDEAQRRVDLNSVTGLVTSTQSKHLQLVVQVSSGPFELVIPDYHLPRFITFITAGRTRFAPSTTTFSSLKTTRGAPRLRRASRSCARFATRTSSRRSSC